MQARTWSSAAPAAEAGAGSSGREDVAMEDEEDEEDEEEEEEDEEAAARAMAGLEVVGRAGVQVNVRGHHIRPRHEGADAETCLAPCGSGDTCSRRAG
jgi:hypothetical protein